LRVSNSMLLPSSPRWLRAIAGRLVDGSFRSSATRRVLANSGWLMLDKAVRAVLGVLVGAWVARHLGPSDYGNLAYVLAVVALFQAIANAGVDAIVVRELARTPDQAGDILGSALLLRFCAGALGWVVAVLGEASLTSDGTDIVMLTAILGASLVFQAADVVDLWFQSQSESRRTVLAKLSVAIASAAVKVVLVLSDATLIAFAVVTAVEGMAAAAALCLAYRRFSTNRQWKYRRDVARRMLAESWPLIISGVLIWVYSRIDQLLIKHLLGARDLGVYAAVLPISQFWQMLPMTAAVSIAPFLARLRLQDESRYEATLVLTFRVFFYGGLITAGITFLFSDVLVRTLFGDAYRAGSQVLAVHSLSNSFCFLGIGHSLWLTNTGQTRVRLYGTALAGASALLLNLLLLPRLGLIAAAYAACAAQLIAAFLVNAAVDRKGFSMQTTAILFRRP